MPPRQDFRGLSHKIWESSKRFYWRLEDFIIFYLKHVLKNTICEHFKNLLLQYNHSWGYPVQCLLLWKYVAFETVEVQNNIQLPKEMFKACQKKTVLTFYSVLSIKTKRPKLFLGSRWETTILVVTSKLM